MTEQLVIYDPADELERPQREALRGGWGVAFVRTRLALRRAAPGADAVVLLASSGLSWAPAFHDLADCAPAVPRLIIASLAFRPRRALLEAARQGARLCFAPSPAALQRGVRDLLRRDAWPTKASARLDTELRRLPPGDLRGLLALAAAHGATTMPVSQFATLLGHSPRTLARWCAAAGSPSPRALLEWGRVLRAAALRELAASSGSSGGGARAVRSVQHTSRASHLRLDAKEPVPLAAAVDAVMAACRDFRGPVRLGVAPTLSVTRGGRR